jgi:hypothetical protein
MFVARRHWRVQVLTGGLILVGVVFAVMLRNEPPDDQSPDEPQHVPVPAAIDALLLSTFDEDRCVTASEADDALGSGLAKADLEHWTVSWAVGAKPDGCVGYSVAPADASISLLPKISPEVHRALEVLREDLLARCLSEEEATRRLESILERLGETGFLVRTDGPVVAPPERMAEVTRHVDEGCYIYSTIGATGDGVRIYFLSGPP